MTNELFGWVWITLGFVAGAVLGMFFHHEDWLGGYSSFPRRLLRLGHIAMVALGGLNVLFSLTAPGINLSPAMLDGASWGLIVGAVAMPACCVVVAWKKGLHMIFAVPVVCLIGAGVLVCVGLARAW